MLREGTAAAARDNQGCGLLHYIRADNDILASQLIAVGCDVDLKDDHEYTPLMLALESGYSKLVRVLLEAGANHKVIFSYSQYTPMHVAAYYAYGDILKALIKAGADLNALDEDQCTPLHIAVQQIDDGNHAFEFRSMA